VLSTITAGGVAAIAAGIPAGLALIAVGASLSGRRRK
jgi:hypothetical protein